MNVEMIHRMLAHTVKIGGSVAITADEAATIIAEIARLTAERDRLRATVQSRIDYWNTKDLKNGWRADESGPCCEKCAMRSEHFTGRADALKAVLCCRDPFQINCSCHLPARQAVKERMLEELRAVFDDHERKDAEETK